MVHSLFPPTSKVAPHQVTLPNAPPALRTRHRPLTNPVASRPPSWSHATPPIHFHTLSVLFALLVHSRHACKSQTTLAVDPGSPPHMSCSPSLAHYCSPPATAPNLAHVASCRNSWKVPSHQPCPATAPPLFQPPCRVQPHAMTSPPKRAIGSSKPYPATDPPLQPHAMTYPPPKERHRLKQNASLPAHMSSRLAAQSSSNFTHTATKDSSRRALLDAQQPCSNAIQIIVS